MHEPRITAQLDCDITARSSIVHRDDTRTMTSTHALFRREKVLTPDGQVAMVPIVSGNAWRGILRRIGEQLIAPVLDYGNTLTPAAAHLIRNGGFLRKSNRTLTPDDERRLKELVPLIGLFGGAGNSRVMSGCTVVSKVVPIAADTLHLLPGQPQPSGPIPPSVHAILGQESISHVPDTARGHRGAGEFDPIRLDVETLIAGTRLSGRIRVTSATPSEYALLADILDTFATTGHLGGHTAAGHGTVVATVATHPKPEGDLNWRDHVRAHRSDAIKLLNTIT